MRTKLLLLSFLLSAFVAPTAHADNKAGLSYGIPLEVSVIGLTYGPRPEVIYTPFEKLKWFETKASLGVMPGPEIFATPLSVGFRGRFFDFALHPMAGMAVTEDIIWIASGETVFRTVMEMDLGLSYDINDQWALDAQAYSGWTFYGDVGPVAGLRFGVRFRP